VLGVGVVVGRSGVGVVGSGGDPVVVDFVAGWGGERERVVSVGAAADHFNAADLVWDYFFDFFVVAGVAVWSGGGAEAVVACARGWKEEQGEGEGQAGGWWYFDEHHNSGSRGNADEDEPVARERWGAVGVESDF
jgi:hypothetical protein